jgi:DNA polymerase-3 subunit alpha
MNYYFDCGCSIPLVYDKIKECDGLPSLSIDYYNLNEDCPDVWDLLCTGRTKGIFQLESNLGQNWSAKVQPHNLSEISAIISIIRPGVLKAVFGNKNMAQHYADRKNHIEEVEYLHKSLEGILADTYSVLLYQEQSMRIATDVADFTLLEADDLRKGLGKKDAKLVADIRNKFVSKSTNKGLVTEEEANSIYDWIEKGNRYCFNKCLSPSTLVETQCGNLKTLDEIQIGEQILSPDGLTTVIDKIDNGNKELYEITLESGKSIQCTLDHKFLCEDGIIRSLIDILEDNHKIMCEDD